MNNISVLVVVDMQKDFVDGVLGTPEAQAIVPNVAERVKKYADMDNTVIIYTRDTHGEDYMETMEGKHLPEPHCIYGTEGWLIVPEVVVKDGRVACLDKPTFGSFELVGAIRRACTNYYDNYQIKSIEICGLCTDICVISNALILKTHYNDIPIVVNSACCAGVTPAKHEAAFEVMRSCQIEVI